jgi:REP element-mobilizing transposase RayT
MPRKPRITAPGFYHIVNHGIEHKKVFEKTEDYAYFLYLLCTNAKEYDVRIHNYAIAPDCYHLLIETRRANLSEFMRRLSMGYSIYFNYRRRRSGHLWQGRYQSWRIAGSEHLHAVSLYIEHYPLRAGLAEDIETYPYSSAHVFMYGDATECLRHAWINEHFHGYTEAVRVFFASQPDVSLIDELKQAAALQISAQTEAKPDESALKKKLSLAKDTKERNRMIYQAYREGYSQHTIARILGLTQPTIHGIISRQKKQLSSS